MSVSFYPLPSIMFVNSLRLVKGRLPRECVSEEDLSVDSFA
ncbi:hypothetical protein NP439_06755 [Oceanobacillus jeddahense]|uniref:Uncharacterized protein n=1 Tax=Oceanobacillus jeddahense TaxID=1462527 RepID=A0ABY5JY22_9BACI|nr:hypothetical protein [Oceanobacillus jeddahense]UUI04347.1 hypothetical protein NP439_06755 [Oceanobacillus jeddahense]